MRRLLLAVPIVTFLSCPAAFGAGFQIAAQGARAMGMGLAYTAVADDASAIYYNPAGLAFQRNEWILGGMVAQTLEGTFDATGPTPAAGVHEEQRDGLNGLPQLYGMFGGAVKFGIGVYAPFGLPMRWEDPPTFSGRFISHTAMVKTINVNPTVAFKAGGFAVGIGGDYMLSKVQLERFIRPAVAPVNIAEVQLKGDIADSSGWGWNAGVMWKSGAWRLGGAYRSAIDVDHEASATFTHLVPGLPATVPNGTFPATVAIEYPSAMNVGIAWNAGSTTFAFDADRTNWSSFDRLDVFVGGATTPAIHRDPRWEDVWAWRVGVETACGPLMCRAGYYRDSTPQPSEDVSPVLPDADRQGFTVGLGFDYGSWALDIADVYAKFDDRTTSVPNNDSYFGTFKTTGNEIAVNFHWRP